MLQTASIDLQLAAIEVPTPKIWPGTKGYRPVLLGDRHGFMPKVLKLIANSPTGSAMLNRKAGFVGGAGFTVSDKAPTSLRTFLKKIGSKGRHKTGNKLLARVAKDYSKLRAFALQVVWAEDRKHISEIYHQRIETVASGPLNDEEEVERYYLCRDWSNTNKYKVREIPAFNPEKAAQEPVQLFFYYEDEPGQEYYPLLDYQAGLNYMEAEGLLGEFHPNNVASNFALGAILKIHNGPVDKTIPDPGDESKTITITAEQQQRQFVQGIKGKFTGPKADKLMVLFGDGTADSAEHMAHLESFTSGNANEFYPELSKLCQQAILSAGQVTSPVVVGIAGEGGLGGNANELVQAFKLYAKTVCRPDQLAILAGFKELFAYLPGVDFSNEPEKPAEWWLDIALTLPIEFTFSEATMELIMTDNELRKMIGLEPLPAGAATAAADGQPDAPAAPTTTTPATPAA